MMMTRKHNREPMTITAIIPQHSSAMSTFDSVPSLHTFLSHVASLHRQDHRGDQCRVTPRKRQRQKLLLLQTHAEGVFWRGLLPLMSQRRHAIVALSILARHFQRFSWEYSAMSQNDEGEPGVPDSCPCEHVRDESNECHNANAVQDRDERERKITRHSFGSWFVISFHRNKLSKRHPNHKSHSRNNNNTPPNQFTILLLPPNPHPLTQNYTPNPSRLPPTTPHSTFSTRLIHYENNRLRLHTLSAYYSTLGGGYFLCRRLSVAKALARRQRFLAAWGGDEDTVWRCRINEGYCYFYAGRVKRGVRVVTGVLGEVLTRLMERGVEIGGGGWGGDVSNVSLLDRVNAKGNYDVVCQRLIIIKNMCLSALWFAEKMKEAQFKESLNGKENQGVSLTRDDFQRIRVVRDCGSRV
ncbi:hypothetical protein HJC23_013811 [Cyclotella cryptica]|uniref:LAGLIDADG homing endonuclease n=1 Tax=Cyclotella cryptica TaxID=29204 RepID=A0ABD3NRS9_9STRA